MRLSTKLFLCTVFSGVFFNLLTEYIRRTDQINDCFGGSAVSLVVAFMPLFSVFLHAKDILISDDMEGFVVSNTMHFLVPDPKIFANTILPEPDYNDEINAWNALPHFVDTADQLPPHCGISECSVENQKEAPADLFYVGPSTHYNSFSWNVDWNSSMTKYLNREAIIPQQAAIFNSVARIYSPQIRQMTGFGYLAADKTSDVVRIQAANLAYSDTRKAFKHYLTHWNPGLTRPIILAGHSQGAEYMLRLLRDEFSNNSTMLSKLIVAYTVGMPVYMNVLQKLGIPSCQTPTGLGCIISWQTYVEGADPSHFYFEPIDPDFRKLKLGERPTDEILSSR
jgi:hypothetical protein